MKYTMCITQHEYFSRYFVDNHVTKNGSETRVIKHYNYIGWPDHGVPDDMGPFIIFYQKIKLATQRFKDRPLLVHCSAGVGRTGTYVALDYLLQQAKSESVINPYSFVKGMRLRRPMMIQSVEQYQFLHQAVYEQRATTGFVSTPNDLATKITTFEQNQGSSKDIISQEFWHIEKKVKMAKFDFSFGKDSANKEKTGFPKYCQIASDMLIDRKYSPYISGNNGIYINAIFVNTYREKNQWLATQLPLSNTIVDFWQLVEDQDVKVVLQLDAYQIPFYPRADDEKMTEGPFTIHRIKTENLEFVTNIALQIKSKKKRIEVTVVLVKAWEADLPQSKLS
ncbi:hypothetical protein EB796_013924 [Bugula neritina]|uniref:Uncharacterized protein n=1 Tax=Bugula neritina TaxID=10212 RepID=A0A7J7JP34_BUGNE|nr:hypothetical protein EB796_013924 [Bugula neritina]